MRRCLPLPILCAALTVFLGLPPGAQKSATAERDKSAIIEEQALLERQLERLKSTMEVLLQRIEAEGRTRTAELLREGLALLQQRTQDAGGELTPEERMQEARAALESGKPVQSLETQRVLIEDLERLVAILLDRKNLEGLEKRIENLKKLQQELAALADQEAALQQSTGELRAEAGGEAQRNLERRLAALEERERALLAKSERLGREAGTLELEQLEKELAALLEAQRTDRSVLEGWQPGEAQRLAGARSALDEARRAEAQAARLDEAERRLRTAAQELESGAKNTSETLEDLRTAVDNARRHANVSKDPAAERAATALEKALRALVDENGDPRADAEAAEELRADADGLEGAAEERRATSGAERARALEALARASAGDTPAARAAQEAQRALERAQRSAQQGKDAREATEEAARTLQEAQSELEFLGEALSGSQAAQAKKSESLQRGLESLPQAGSEAGAQGARALGRAAEAMRNASQAARGQDQPRALEQARAAESALEEAQKALARARERAASSSEQSAAELAAEQARTAEETGALAKQASEGALSKSAEQAVERALSEAQSAMESAHEALQQGKSASAANAQRAAIESLQAAGRAAREGVRLRTEPERKRAEELAAEQERLRQEILDLARRIKQREEPRSRPDLSRAEAQASAAKGSLEQGDPAQAQAQESEVERELRQAKSELQEEEEQYQRLRAEEQLFRIAEDTAALLEAHRVQMKELAELDAERAGSESPSRSQKMRLRRIAREEGVLGTRAEELAAAIEKEGTKVAAGLLAGAASDLARLAKDLGEEGDYQTGERVQGLQRDVEQALLWLLDALRAEQVRRQNERKDPSGQQQQDQGEPPLIPDSTELKLLRRMEIELRESLDGLRALHPELAGEVELDPDVLRDLARLAGRHERLTELFKDLRARVGIPPPESAED